MNVVAARLAFGALGVLGLCEGRAHADPPVITEVPVATVVPTVSLSGSTTGKGKGSVGLDVRRSIGREWDAHVAPSFTVSSADGVANLLSIAGDAGPSGPVDWALGLTISLVDRSPAALDSSAERLLEGRALCRRRAQLPAPSDDEKAFYEQHAALARALLTAEPDRSVRAVIAARATAVLERLHPECATTPEACACSPDALDRCKEADLGEILVAEARRCFPGGGAACTPESARVYAWLARVDTEVDPARLCKLGQKLAGAGQGEALERARHPRHLLALGATYGATQIKALSGPTDALTPSTQIHANVLVGALYTYVAPSEGAHFSLELPALFKSSYKAPSTTVKWCVPAGTATTKRGTGAAQICDEQPLGAPRHTSQLWTAILVGVAAEKGVVRFALGPTFSYDAASSSSAPYQIGVQAPLYVSLLKGLPGYSSDYEGIVRLVPSFAVNHTDRGLVPVAAITLELLGKRGMFGSALYWP